MSASNLSDILADIRMNPEELGKQMAYQDNAIQERVFEMFVGFIRELSIQDQNYAYVNGNMAMASKGNAVHYLLTDNRIVR